jgi:hypothetical protein
MRIHSTRRETNLTELARQLFNLSGPHEAAMARLAVDALRRANPHLRPESALPEGTPVLVPDVEGLEPAAASRSVGSDLADEAAKQLRAALGGAAKALDAAVEEELKAEEDAAEQLKRHERELSAVSPDVPERLAKIREAAKARKEELSQHTQFQKTGLARLGKDLEAFAKMMSLATGEPPPG